MKQLMIPWAAIAALLLPADAALVKTWSIVPAGAQATIQDIFVLQTVTASDFNALSPDSFGAAMAAMNSFAPVCGLKFVYTAAWQSADVVISADASPQQFGDAAYYAGFQGGNVSMDDRGGVHVTDALTFRAFDLPVTGQPSLKRIIQHEAGHAAGLRHSADPLSLMYPTYSDDSFGWSAEDVANLRALYGPADAVPEPASLVVIAAAGVIGLAMTRPSRDTMRTSPERGPKWIAKSQQPLPPCWPDSASRISASFLHNRGPHT